MKCPMSGNPSRRELHTLHLAEDKFEKYLKYTPMLTLDDAESNFVFDPAVIKEILKSSNFSVICLADEYRIVSEQTNIDLDAMIKTMDVMPLFTNGEKHKKLRLSMAKILGKNRSSQIGALETVIDEVLEETLVDGGSINLLDDLSLLMYHALTAAIVGVDWEQTFITDEYPRTLDPGLSLNRRKALNLSLMEALENHEGEDILPEHAMALVMLGHDTFVGTVALSLWQVLDRNPNTPLNEIEWPKSFPITSAPYTERIALADWESNGVKISAGERIRLVLDASAEYGPLETEDLLFGKGSHVCIGRAISELGWRLLVNRLGQSSLRARTKPLEYRRPDSCFCYPIRSEVIFYE